MIKKWNSYNKIEESIKGKRPVKWFNSRSEGTPGTKLDLSRVLSTKQIKEINDRLSFIVKNDLYTEDEGFYSCQTEATLWFIDLVFDHLVSLKFDGETLPDIQTLISKKSEYLFGSVIDTVSVVNLLKNFLDSELTYHSIDRELSEILLELKDEFDIHEEKLSTGELLYYNYVISDLLVFIREIDSTSIDLSEFKKLTIIVDRISLKLKEIGWKSAICVNDSLLSVKIYKI